MKFPWFSVILPLLSGGIAWLFLANEPHLFKAIVWASLIGLAIGATLDTLLHLANKKDDAEAEEEEPFDD